MYQNRGETFRFLVRKLINSIPSVKSHKLPGDYYPLNLFANCMQMVK